MASITKTASTSNGNLAFEDLIAMSTTSTQYMQLRAGSEHQSSEFLFISMFTKNYESLANRLATSMEKHSLPYALYEVPTVHNSISERGSDDCNYTKSSFIRNVMDRTGKNIVYIDCDCEIKKFPSLIFENAKNYDFAVYNWLSSQENNVYIPYHNHDASEVLYRFSHSIEPTCDTQLICSGAVQYWANSGPSIELLNYWQSIIECNKGAADDYCLDFSFNNFQNKSCNKLKYYWLPKAYARYAWWIFDQPIIDHPQIPNTSTKWNEPTDAEGRKRFYAEQFNTISKKDNKYDGVIYPQKNIHARNIGNGDISLNVIAEKIWITRSSL